MRKSKWVSTLFCVLAVFDVPRGTIMEFTVVVPFCALLVVAFLSDLGWASTKVRREALVGLALVSGIYLVSGAGGSPSIGPAGAFFVGLATATVGFGFVMEPPTALPLGRFQTTNPKTSSSDNCLEKLGARLPD